jgi:hypothetical protein
MQAEERESKHLTSNIITDEIGAVGDSNRDI